MTQAIVIPVYKKELSANEVHSLKQCINVFAKREIILIAPNGLDLSFYLSFRESIKELRFGDHFFKNIQGYNKLLLSPDFYQKLSDYDYILIYQLDAFVFRDELDIWCDKKYDYIGAPIINNEFVTPWLKHLTRRNIMLKLGLISNENVGNGGFSLRKISSFIRNSKKFKNEIQKWDLNEDLFWSFRLPVLNPFFRIPSMKVAVAFSIEDSPEHCYKLNERKLPFGCHAWEKYDKPFWEKFITPNE